MEQAPGIQLGEAWETMDPEVKLKIVEELVGIEKKLLSMSFSRFVIQVPCKIVSETDINSYSCGNIYFSDNAIPGCEPLKITSNLLFSQKKEIEDRFVIGPVVSHDFWDQERAYLDIDRGPCKPWTLMGIDSADSILREIA
jgi:hypothetical protein